MAKERSLTEREKSPIRAEEKKNNGIEWRYIIMNDSLNNPTVNHGTFRATLEVTIRVARSG